MNSARERSAQYVQRFSEKNNTDRGKKLFDSEFLGVRTGPGQWSSFFVTRLGGPALPAVYLTVRAFCRPSFVRRGPARPVPRLVLLFQNSGYLAQKYFFARIKLLSKPACTADGACERKEYSIGLIMRTCVFGCVKVPQGKYNHLSF